MLKFSIVFTLVLLLSSPAMAICTCIYKGGTVKEGETACIWTAEGNTLARCEKVLNMTSWKQLGEDCPGALSQSRLPDPKISAGTG